MKVLFIGNYDIAGQYLATRLFKEGYGIVWLTEETEKELWEPSVKGGKVYRFGLSYHSCSQIIKTESPECIVFLTQVYRDCYDYSFDETSGAVETIMELLRAAASLSVKKIVYLSSNEVTEGTLLNPAFESLRAGERLCQSVCETVQMDCLIVRTGIVYGMGKYPEAGFLAQAVKHIYENGQVHTDFSSFSSFDLVYGSDFADAVERLLVIGESGVHTLTTGYPITLNELYHTIAEHTKQNTVNIQYGSKEHIEHPEDGKLLKRRTGWLPFYLPADILPDVILHYIQIFSEQDHTEKKKKQKEHIFLKNLAENIALFAILIALSLGSSDWSDIRFVDIKLLYIIVVALTFGMRQGVIAIFLATAAYLAKLALAEVDLSYIAYNIETWIPFIIYAVAGALVGYLSDKKRDELENGQEAYAGLRVKYNFLKTMYQEVLTIKNQLQKQIMTSKDSLGHVYEITEGLENTKPRSVMLRTVKVVEETLECSSVAIYIKGGPGSAYGRLMACSGNIAKDMAASIKFSDYRELEQVISQKEMYVNIALYPDYPSFAMPVFDEDRMVAVVMIYNLDPNKYTEYYKNLFKTLVLIMRSCLIRAYHYQENNKDQIYLPDTNILVSEEFGAELESITQASEDLNIPFSKGRILYDAAWSYQMLSEKLSKLIRGTDIVGCDKDGTVFVILLFVIPSVRTYTEKRFAEAGISVFWEG